MKANILKDEKGIALVVAILLLLVVTLIGISGVNLATFDNMIAGNKRASDQAFYVAEAGIHELIGRFRTSATYPISDNNPTSPDWKLLLLKTGGQGATKVGTIVPSPSQTVPSLQNQLDFGVVVEHITEGGIVKTVNNFPLYKVTSYGYTDDGGHKVIETELRKGPSFGPDTALYSEAVIKLSGTLYISGKDGCPNPANKPGVITTQPLTKDLEQSIKKGDIVGIPQHAIVNSPDLYNIRAIADELRGYADVVYTNVDKVTGNKINNDPNKVANWGNPTPVGDKKAMQFDSTAKPPMNIVYFDMKNTKDNLLMMQDVKGQGILIVDGDLKATGGFHWYGIIIVTGHVEFLGQGGKGKNITGGVFAGQETQIKEEVVVGGGIQIIYCNQAISRANLATPFRMSRWKEKF